MWPVGRPCRHSCSWMVATRPFSGYALPFLFPLSCGDCRHMVEPGPLTRSAHHNCADGSQVGAPNGVRSHRLSSSPDPGGTPVRHQECSTWLPLSPPPPGHGGPVGSPTDPSW